MADENGAEKSPPQEAAFTLDFDFPAEVVWRRIGGFADLDAWHPAVAGCQAESEEIGALRQVRMIDDSQNVERLERLDAEERVQVYSMVDPGPPFVSYVATLEVSDLGENRSQARWSSEYELVPEVPLEAFRENVKRFYRMGLEAARSALAEG